MEVFVARQPIFNKKEEVVAYELLYRNNEENSFPNVDGDQATADVIINSFLNIGIDQLSNGKPCFINFTEKLLKLRLPTYFRPRDIVVEILETVEPDEELIEICKELKELGYLIALDDIVINEENPYSCLLFQYVDIFKVDFLQTSKETRQKIEAIGKKLNVKMVAEKVETREAYEEARKSGYDYFQGYFFARPTLVSSHDVPTYLFSNYEMINGLTMNGNSMNKIIDYIERDVSLSYKLLKLTNSPAYRPKQKIHSIREAVVLLGLIEIKKWFYVLSIREKASEKPEIAKETIVLSLTRAKMCESIGKLKDKTCTDSGYFLTGMFSLMDAIIGIPMDQILKELPLQDKIVACLNGVQNSFKDVLDFVYAVENAQWKAISSKCREYGIHEKDLFKIYAESLSWSQELIVDKSYMLEPVEF